MKAFFFSAGPIEWGSSRMRCYWPAQYMDAEVMPIKEAIGDLRKGAPLTIDDEAVDAVIFQKVADTDVMDDLRESGFQVWWDVCDPAWWFAPDDCRKILRRVDGVGASNEPLLQDLLDWADKHATLDREIQAHTIPDRLELSHFDRQKEHGYSHPVRLVWYGVSVNRVSLHAALPALSRLKTHGYDIELTIIDDRPDIDVGREAYGFPIHTVGWNLEQEVEMLLDHDIALLPPYPGAWGHVKSNNKTMTAYACGLPVATGTDYCQLEALMQPDKRRQAGANGRAIVEREYDVKQSAADWERIICSTSS